MFKAPTAAAAAVLFVVSFAAPALADGFVIQKGTTDKGCVIYAVAQYEGSGAVVPFSGACTPGQPVDGKGTMTGGGDKAFVGTWVKGFMHGNFTIGGDPAVMDMGCPVSFRGQPMSQPGCKEAVAKFLGTKPAAAAAKPATAVAATPVAAAAPGKKLTEADYRQACAAHFTPAAFAERVKEYKDMNGSEYAAPDVVERESREGVAKEDRERLASIASVSDAEFKKAYETKDTYYQQMAAIPDGHPMLQKNAGIAMARCLLKTRLAATPSLSAAAPVAAPKTDPATALATPVDAPKPATAPAVPAAPVAAAKPAPVPATPVAAVPAAMPGVEHYQKACAAEFTPAAIEQRARESRDSYGDTIEEARVRSKQDDANMMKTLATMSDDQLKQNLAQMPGSQELFTMSDSDPRLAKFAGTRYFRCLLLTRVAAGKARDAAAPKAATAAVAAKPAMTAERIADCDIMVKALQQSAATWPGTSAEISTRLGTQQKNLFTTMGCAGHPQAAAYIAGAEKMIADGAKPAATAGLKPSQFAREEMSRCLAYKLVSSKATGAYAKYVFSYTNTCNVELHFNASILQNGQNINLLRAGGIIKPQETREFDATIPVAKTMSLRMQNACETKEQVERSLGRKVTSNNFNDQLRKCTGFFYVPPTGGVGK